MIDCTLDSIKWLLSTPSAAILVSGLLGAMGVASAIRSSRAIARRDASVKFIFDTHENARIRSSQRMIRRMHDDESYDIENLAYGGGTPSEKNDVGDLRYILNHYEHMAVAVHHRAFDENILKENRHRIVTQLWVMCEPYVKNVRKRGGTNTTYQDLELLANRWIENPLQRKRRTVRIPVIGMTIPFEIGTPR